MIEFSVTQPYANTLMQIEPDQNIALRIVPVAGFSPLF